MTIEELMQSVGVAKWPARWASFYDEVMAGFDAHGCPFADPAYYEQTAKTYGFPTRYLPYYQKAAASVGQNEPLARALALVCRALSDREAFVAEVKEFAPPVAPDGTDDLGYALFMSLALASTVPYTVSILQKRNMPQDVIRQELSAMENGIDSYAVRHGGRIGYTIWDWHQRTVDGHLFRLGRLEGEFYTRFVDFATVFQNKSTGGLTALAQGVTVHKSGRVLGSADCEDEAGSYQATLDETEEGWRGHPFLPNSLIGSEPVFLPRAEWRPVLRPGDPVVGLHIPAEGRLTPADVDASLADIKRFAAAYFPEYRYLAFTCNSWLMDPQLETLLGADANIVRFARRFTRLTRRADGNAVFHFVYLTTGPVPPETLPEDTRLHRALKAHFLAGRHIYESYGFFLP